MASNLLLPEVNIHPKPDFIVIRVGTEAPSSLPADLEFAMSGSHIADSIQEQTLGGGSDGPCLPGDRRVVRNISIETFSSTGSDVGGASSLTTPTEESSQELSLGKIPFFSGIPSVEVVRGILYLYKMKKPPDEEVSETVCALNVPAEQQLSAILESLSPVLSTVSRLRVIRDSTPNRYMLLVTFKDKGAAAQFYSSFNGRPYNTLEECVWQLVYVARVEILKSSRSSSSSGPGLVELPSCPVCLERLDESVLTILCNHSFHTTCLTRWEDSTCPICRYLQTPEPCEEDTTCTICDAKEDLWMCLICGHIGCGRYVGGHANTHFAETQHTFSMQLGTAQRVWDYIGDNYVHRLVQNKADGKLVEVSGGPGLLGDNEKVDSLQLEYTYLLTSQLESQRLYFEEKLARVEKDLNEQLSVMEARCRSAVGDKERLEEQQTEFEKDKKCLEKKVGMLQTKLTKAGTQLKEEKELNKCLSDNQKLWRERVTMLEQKMETIVQEKEKELGELRDQVRDLMFYLETQKKVARSPEDEKQDIQEGHVIVTQGATPSRRQRKKK